MHAAPTRRPGRRVSQPREEPSGSSICRGSMVSEPQRIYISPPHLSGREIEFLTDAVKSNWIAPLGPHVDAFEEELASTAGVSDAAALASGTAAIHLALAALGIGPDDLVYCSTLSFVASANPILYVGATPVFVDVDPHTWNIDVAVLAQGLDDAASRGELPKAIIVVDLYGQPADYTSILDVCGRYGVAVIEDAAEALGATYRGQPAGSFGVAGTLSFNGNKIITTSGGGALVSDDSEFVARTRFLSTQARDPGRHHEHSELGFNYRLSNLLAAVGRAQLTTLDERVRARRRVFNRYVETIGALPGVRFQSEHDAAAGTRWFSTFTVDAAEAGVDRDGILDALQRENIEARPVWKPIHSQPLYDGASVLGGSAANNIFAAGVCLPSGSSLTGEQQDRVIAAVAAAFYR